MPPLRRISTALITGAAIVAGTGLAIAATDAAGPADEQGAPLTLAATVDGLTPGAARDLPVTIANPNAKPLAIASIATSVSTGSQGCPASALVVGDLGAPVTVAGDATALVRLPVRLSGDAPDACQGAVFALRFSTTGRGEGALVPVTPVAPTTPAAPSTPMTPPATATAGGAFKTVIVKRRRKVCKRRRVRVRGVVRRRKVCRTVIMKVKVRVPR